jgi:hypothetical protein
MNVTRCSCSRALEYQNLSSELKTIFFQQAKPPYIQEGNGFEEANSFGMVNAEI